jgi:hypothetical protein
MNRAPLVGAGTQPRFSIRGREGRDLLFLRLLQGHGLRERLDPTVRTAAPDSPAPS